MEEVSREGKKYCLMMNRREKKFKEEMRNGYRKNLRTT